MALSAQDKIHIRRHLLVPFAGVPFSQYTAGLRTILTVGQLEFYMNALQAEEECLLTGYPYGQINLYGTVVAGQTVTVVVNGVSSTYTVTANDAKNNQALQPVVGGLAQAINTSSAAIMAASGSITSGDVTPAVLPVFGQVTLVNQVPFTLTASATGGLQAVVIANGSVYPSPNFVDAQGTAHYGYIAICNYLEERIASVDLSLSYQKADVVGFRKDELSQRTSQYNFWRTKMGILLSVGPNPAGTAGMGSGFGITAV